MPAADYVPRRHAFRKLHESGCFAIPNPWDSGSAKYLQSLGFQALATTSSGIAFARGVPDSGGALSRDAMLAAIAEIVSAVDIPVNADFMGGYAHQPKDVAENVELCVRTGVAGLSIEDATGDAAHPLYELPLAVERVIAAREAIARSGADVLLTARAECCLYPHPEPLKEAIRRLERYAEAGADVLYAPGPQRPEDIRAIVQAVRPKPVNVLVSSNSGLTLKHLEELGVRRVSVGSALARAAWTGFIRAAQGISQRGEFTGFDGITTFGELNAFFQRGA